MKGMGRTRSVLVAMCVAVATVLSLSLSGCSPEDLTRDAGSPTMEERSRVIAELSRRGFSKGTYETWFANGDTVYDVTFGGCRIQVAKLVTGDYVFQSPSGLIHDVSSVKLTEKASKFGLASCVQTSKG